MKQRTLWIDLVTAPDVPFFYSIIKELEKQKLFKIFITGRKYLEVPELIKKYDLKGVYIIDSFFGKSKKAKLVSLFLRIILLFKFAISRRISLGFSFCSRPQTFVAWLLRIPMVNMGDYEFGNSALIYPFSHTVYIPEELTHLKKGENVKIYPGLKESIYAYDFVPDVNEITEAGIDLKKTIIVIRMNSIYAHYHSGSDHDQIDEQIISYLSQFKHVQVVVLPRYKVQRDKILSQFPNHENVVLLKKRLNGQNLIWFSDGVISGGGSMIREAVCLNRPSYDIFGGKLGEVEKALIKAKKVVKIESASDFPKIVLQKKPVPDTVTSDRTLLHFITQQLTEIS